VFCASAGREPRFVRSFPVVPDAAFDENDKTEIAGIACSSVTGDVFVSLGRRVHVFRSDGTPVRQFTVMPAGGGAKSVLVGQDVRTSDTSDTDDAAHGPAGPGCLAVDDAAGELYMNNQVFDFQGVRLRAFIVHSAKLRRPFAVDSRSGRVFTVRGGTQLTEQGNPHNPIEVVVLDRDNSVVRTMGDHHFEGSYFPRSLALSARGDLFVINDYNDHGNRSRIEVCFRAALSPRPHARCSKGVSGV
jgi:hypothetical protein